MSSALPRNALGGASTMEGGGKCCDSSSFIAPLAGDCNSYQENYNQYNEPFPWTPESDRLSNQAPRQQDYASYQQSGPGWLADQQSGQQHPLYQQHVQTASHHVTPTSQMEREKLRPKQGAARMPKVRALSLVQSLKRWVIVASITAFGLFSALVAGNLNNTASAKHSSLSSQTTNQTPTTTANPADPNAGGFFGNQGGGYGFGNGGSTQSPGTSSHVS